MCFQSCFFSHHDFFFFLFPTTAIKEELVGSRVEVKSFDKSKLNHVETKEKNPLPNAECKYFRTYLVFSFFFSFPLPPRPPSLFFSFLFLHFFLFSFSLLFFSRFFSSFFFLSFFSLFFFSFLLLPLFDLDFFELFLNVYSW